MDKEIKLCCCGEIEKSLKPRQLDGFYVCARTQSAEK